MNYSQYSGNLKENGSNRSLKSRNICRMLSTEPIAFLILS